MGAVEFLHAFETREGEPDILQAKWYIIAVTNPPSSKSNILN
jgi:hypothetical protein